MQFGRTGSQILQVLLLSKKDTDMFCEQKLPCEDNVLSKPPTAKEHAIFCLWSLGLTAEMNFCTTYLKSDAFISFLFFSYQAQSQMAL